MKFYTFIWTSGIEHRMLNNHSTTELYPIPQFWFLIWRIVVNSEPFFQTTDADEVIFEMLTWKQQRDLSMSFAVEFQPDAVMCG